MAHLDYIFKKAQGLIYIGEGAWRAKCPVKGCDEHSLTIRQTNLYQRCNGEVSETLGTVTCSHGCSLAEIINAFDIHLSTVFLQEQSFEFDPENYTCLLDDNESLALIKHEAKYFLEFLESKDFDSCSPERIDRYWVLAQGLRWFLISGYWALQQKSISTEDVINSEDWENPFL